MVNPSICRADQLCHVREDLNTLVKRHIQAVVSSSPPRALVTLEQDTSELIASGMVTLNAKLMEIEDEKLVARVVEIWGFFWDNVLTYVEGVRRCSSKTTFYRLTRVKKGLIAPPNRPAAVFPLPPAKGPSPSDVPFSAKYGANYFFIIY